MVKKISLLLVLIVLSLVILINFSETSSKYECIGSLKSSNSKKENVKLFFVYNQYRPWIRIFSKSDGDLRIEIPNHWTQYYSHVEDTGNKDEHLHIKKNKNEMMNGFFSMLSKTIWMKLDLNEEIYEGECKEIK